MLKFDSPTLVHYRRRNYSAERLAPRPLPRFLVNSNIVVVVVIPSLLTYLLTYLHVLQTL